MTSTDTIRAWKNEEYRPISSNTVDQISEEPSGLIELTDTQMAAIGGGSKKKGDNIIVITQPIIVGGDYSGGPIVPINIIIIADKGKK